MIRQLADQKIDLSNVHQFLAIFDDFPLSSMLPDATYFTTLCEIVRIINDKTVGADGIEDAIRFKIQTLQLLTSVRKDLATDCTVQFTKTCKQVQSLVDALQQPRDEEQDLLSERRQAGLLACMADAYKLYKRQWARQPVDFLLKAGAIKRLCFRGTQLDTMDNLTTAITLDQRASSSNTGPRTIRTYDSTAHPLRQKNIGILR
jgi:hypothetical protein